MTRVSLRMPVLAVAAAALVTGPLIGAAQADSNAAPAEPYGTVVTDSLNTRQYPSKDSSVKDVLSEGEQVGLDCKVGAQDVDGNDTWFKVRGKEQWGAARYIKNTGEVPLCKDKFPSSLNDSEQSQNAKG